MHNNSKIQADSTRAHLSQKKTVICKNKPQNNA